MLLGIWAVYQVAYIHMCTYMHRKPNPSQSILLIESIFKRIE